jgi:glutamate dehydrogenase (NAD(P)+)
MEEAFRLADELRPLKLVYIHRSAVGLKAVVAIDNIACGPAIGGVRMAPDVSTEEAFSAGAGDHIQERRSRPAARWQ